MGRATGQPAPSRTVQPTELPYPWRHDPPHVPPCGRRGWAKERKFRTFLAERRRPISEMTSEGGVWPRRRFGALCQLSPFLARAGVRKRVRTQAHFSHQGQSQGAHVGVKHHDVVALGGAEQWPKPVLDHRHRLQPREGPWPRHHRLGGGGWPRRRHSSADIGGGRGRAGRSRRPALRMDRTRGGRPRDIRYSGGLRQASAIRGPPPCGTRQPASGARR